jgi:hypothetical protein
VVVMMSTNPPSPERGGIICRPRWGSKSIYPGVQAATMELFIANLINSALDLI